MVPAYPSVSEMAGDAWDELVGYDGRFLRTLRMLLAHPGHLTKEVLQGRRARYIFPIRLYLFASFVYFVVAAVAPPAPIRTGGFTLTDTESNLNVRLDNSLGGLSAEDRAKLAKEAAEMPPILRPLMLAVAEDPQRFQRSLYENMPRVLFVLVPLFAVAMRVFYRGGWVQHLTCDLVVVDSDEHTEDGHLTEDHAVRIAMVEKRMRKGEGLAMETLQPLLAGPPDGEILLIGFGSTKGVIAEAREILSAGGVATAAIHLRQVAPFPAQAVSEIVDRYRTTFTVENNRTGQLARLIRAETGREVTGTIGRFDGLPFTPEELANGVKERL